MRYKMHHWTNATLIRRIWIRRRGWKNKRGKKKRGKGGGRRSGRRGTRTGRDREEGERGYKP
jgi:hypothetical protein